VNKRIIIVKNDFKKIVKPSVPHKSGNGHCALHPEKYQHRAIVFSAAL
jgi:hypothetical protein